MKKLLGLFSIVLLVSCTEAGTIQQPEIKNILIKGKNYSIHEVYLRQGEHPITILVPEDSSYIPQTIIQENQSGKTYYNTSTVIIK